MPWMKHKLFRKPNSSKLNLESVTTKALYDAANEYLKIRKDASISIGELLGKLNCPPDEAREIIASIGHMDASKDYMNFVSYNTRIYNQHKSK